MSELSERIRRNVHDNMDGWIVRLMREAADDIDGFASQVWGLSLLAQAELDNGDTEGAKKTLVRLAVVAAQRAPETDK